MNAVLSWSPLVPTVVAYALVAVGTMCLALAWRTRAKGLIARGGFFLLLAILSQNPVPLEESRDYLNDKLLIVVDQSDSQKIGGRDKVADQALESLLKKLENTKGVDPVIINAPYDPTGNKGTQLFASLQDQLVAIPADQSAGTIFITDGQVHDTPATPGNLAPLAPFHVILTGKKSEFDRKVTLVSAPKYGLLTDEVHIKVKLEQTGRQTHDQLIMGVFQDGEKYQDAYISPGEEQEFTFTLKHPGQNVFEFKIPPDADELTPYNNDLPVIVNGIRDRLRVMLISGTPHMGERAWRNLLKSDPSIDLVHFTILRSLQSVDAASPKELSLIEFPVEELFQKKIRDFDLIIFDRYQQFPLMRPSYFSNIASFVKNGGAFFMILGTDNDDNSIFKTAVKDIMPVEPSADQNAIVKSTYMPKLTEKGKTFPASADTAGSSNTWGEWYAQSMVRAKSGQTLMTGINDAPLLVTDKSGDGRIAVLTSDNAWLWSKGGKMAGPYTAFLRNIAHWLMKEPELEENYIKTTVSGNTITVSQRLSENNARDRSLAMTSPSGTTQQIMLETKDAGWAAAAVTAEQSGIYVFSSEDKKAYAIVGHTQNIELSDVHTTDEILKPLIRRTTGGTVWFQDNPNFGLGNESKSARSFGGDGWIGLRRNNAYNVKNIIAAPILSDALMLLLIACGLFSTWWSESRKTKS